MEIRRSVMGRPDLSWRGIQRSTFGQHRPAPAEILLPDSIVVPKRVSTDIWASKTETLLQRPVNRGLGQRRHDLVSSGVGVQAVFGQVTFEQALVVDHGAEVVE